MATGAVFYTRKKARFMSGLFTKSDYETCLLLDAGAGIGSLSSAFLERCISNDLNFKLIHLAAFELDDTLHADLSRSLAHYAEKTHLSFDIIGGDFIDAAIKKYILDKNALLTRYLTLHTKKLEADHDTASCFVKQELRQ